MAKNHRTAFSFIEVSIVIVVLGIMIIGVGKGLDLFRDYRIAAAQHETETSRVVSVDGLVFWYETTLPQSFLASDDVDDGVVISQWNDISSQGSIKLHAKAGQKTDDTQITYNISDNGTAGNTSGPTYILDGINHLPTLRFTNTTTNDFRYLVVDRRMRNNAGVGMTLFVVMKYRSGHGYFIDRACHINGAAEECPTSPSEGNPLFELATDIDLSGSLLGVARGTNVSDAYIYDTGYDLQPDGVYIITFERDFGNNFTVYVNGNAAYGGTPSLADGGEPIVNLDPYKIGRHHDWSDNNDIDISEVIFYTGRVKTSDRERIEDYLGKKYNIAVTH